MSAEEIEQGIHTPGPWTLSGNIVNGPHYAVAIVGGIYPTQDANARLIAAAPELLAALKMARTAFVRRSNSYHSNFLDELNAAIAKAEGRE